MNVRKTDAFLADIERQCQWYVANAGWDVADRCLDAVEAACRLLFQQPKLGPSCGFAHPKLRAWRSFLILRPLAGTSCFTKSSPERSCGGAPCMGIATCPADCSKRPAIDKCNSFRAPLFHKTPLPLRRPSPKILPCRPAFLPPQPTASGVSPSKRRSIAAGPIRSLC